MRSFIAVELPEELREEVAACQSELKQNSTDVKWVEVGNLHLTLKFLGDVEESRISTLKEALVSAAQGVSPFTIHLEGIGAFPGTTSPRVIWLGVTEGKEPLVALAEKVEQACAGLGFAKEERPFSPHLTIGRVRSRDQLAALIKKLQAAEFRGSHPAPIDRIILFQSALSPQGPTYTPLADIPLGGYR